MCRKIRTLYNIDPPETREEIREASIQFIRKVSGFQNPSSINETVFNQAVGKITLDVQKLLDSLVTKSKPINRQRS